MDKKDYRRALGSFPTGVTIVTVFDEKGEPWGLTANSFTSVSLEPPVISVCVAKSGRVFLTLKTSTRFAVNILSDQQRDLAMHFASNTENRFTGTPWEAQPDGAPLFPNASARLDCVVHERVDAGDHEILLGRVVYYDHLPHPPLTFCRGVFFPGGFAGGHRMSDCLTYHTRFTPQEFDAQYNLRAGRPDYEETVVPAWIQRSETAREALDCTLDVRYGDGPKQKLDVFKGGDASAPVLVFFHGGYWQRGDKSVYSFIAEPFAAAGVNVVLLGYDLCPAVSITRISEEAREAMAYLWRNAPDLGISRDRITFMGHSAGGHITQMMMATDWPAYAEDLPADLIKAGIPVSPLSYLEPVRLTEALNAGIRMDAAEAERESPMTNHPPVTDAPQLVVVGGKETDEFHRQGRMYVKKYQTGSRSIGFYVVPGVDHFDELNVLTDPSSEFFKKTCAMFGLN